MRYVELIECAKSVIETIRTHDVRLDDIDHVEMYRNYERLRKEGHKVEYILQYLSEVYGYSPRHIRRICDRMAQDI